MSDEPDELTDFLYGILGAVPHPEFGVVNFFPWAVDSDSTNSLKREVCKGLAGVLRDGGFIATKESAPVEPSRDVSLACRLCSSTLLTTQVNDQGVANVPATAIIASISRLNPQCPHKPLTADDQRILIEEAVRAARSSTEPEDDMTDEQFDQYMAEGEPAELTHTGGRDEY